MIHLERFADGWRLSVGGKPFVVLGGELRNSTASALATLEACWPEFAGLNLNTLLVPVSWELVEPREGEFDFSLVGGLLAWARDKQLKLVLLWFGLWKNSMSCYAPAWVKQESTRFFRARTERGNPLDIVSPFCDAARQADARAFARSPPCCSRRLPSKRLPCCSTTDPGAKKSSWVAM